MKKPNDTHAMRALQRQSKERAKPITRTQQRLIEAAVSDEIVDILYQHSALCSVYLPHRNQGNRIDWVRNNDKIQVVVKAGEVPDPQSRQRIFVGLPFGPKVRVLIAHLNRRVMLTRSPVIEIDSVTRFAAKDLGIKGAGGRTLRDLADQVARLSACNISIIGFEKNRAIEVKGIINAFDICVREDDRQRMLWPSVIRFSDDYCQSLFQYAVPLSEVHISALSHNSLGLDIYAWLAQRLHRVKPGKPVTVFWSVLHAQFGGRARLNNFRADFLIALKQVLVLYRDAKLDVTAAGVKLYHSKPVVMPRVSIVVSLLPGDGEPQ